MSKPELLELIAPLSPAERQELREILDESQPKDTALEAFLEWQNGQPPLDLPPDFSINHDYYIHGAPKVAE